MEYVSILWTLFTFLNIVSGTDASPKRFDDRNLEEVSYEGRKHYHHHQERKIRDLRDKLDKALLRQEIQEIELNNFKKSLKSTESILGQLIEGKKEPLNLSKDSTIGKPSKPESANVVKAPETVNQVALEAQMDLRQDFLRLKAEMEVLKSSCFKSLSESDAKREDTTLKWLLQVVPLLQQNLGDLQESTNLLEEMHNKKEMDIKMESLSAEMTSMATSLAKMTAKVEATEAVAQMLNQEVAQSSSQLHQVETKIAVIKEKLDEDTEILDSLLKALPDGFIGSKHTKLSSRLLNSKPPPSVEIHDDQNVVQKIQNLELKTATLDYALLNLQKKIFMQSTENVQSTSPEEPNQAMSTSLESSHFGSEYLERLKVVEDELSKIRKSSVSLVKMLSDVEIFDEGIRDKITENMAELETQIEHEREDRKANENDSKSSRRELELEEHTDILEFKRILDRFGESLNNLEHGEQNDKCFDILQNRLNVTDERVSKLEEFIRHGNHGDRRRRHHRGSEVS